MTGKASTHSVITGQKAAQSHTEFVIQLVFLIEQNSLLKQAIVSLWGQSMNGIWDPNIVSPSVIASLPSTQGQVIHPIDYGFFFLYLQ